MAMWECSMLALKTLFWGWKWCKDRKWDGWIKSNFFLICVYYFCI